MKTIVVVDKNYGIGKNNNLLFSLPLDMKNFREKTLGKIVVMGANTFLSLPKGALPNRKNIVLDDQNRVFENAVTVTSLPLLLQYLQQFDSDDIFVIGGAAVYKLLLEYCDTVYITKVDADGEAELLFPNLDKMPEWQAVYKSPVVVDNGLNTTYNIFKK